METRASLRACRDELKGLAILWIVFFHAKLGLGGVAGALQSLGYGGVDVFFFLTGFGLCHSLAKSDDLGSYLRRRLWRVLPAYLPVCVLWLAVMLPVLNLSTVPAAQTALGNLLLLGYWADSPEMLSWYVSGLFTVILLAPFFYACLKAPKRPLLARGGLVALTALAGLCFAFDQRLIMVSRLPVFALGMLFALPRQRELPPLWHALSFAAGAGVLWLCMTRFPDALMDYGMYWYPFALIAPPLCVWLARLMGGERKALAPLRFLGRASFEIFLLNAWMELFLKKAVGEAGPLVWLLCSLGCTMLGCLYHLAVEAVLRKARKA